MNLTEAMQVILRMAIERAHVLPATRAEKAALMKAGVRIRMMQWKLDRMREARREQNRRALNISGAISYDAMRTEVTRVLPCHACRAVAGNPLLCCTGDFECALQRLRFTSSEVVALRTALQNPTAK